LQLPQGITDQKQREADWEVVRLKRDQRILKNRLAARYATEFQHALEKELQTRFTKELKWDSGDFTCATVVNVTPVLRQNSYGFDFDEQKLFFQLTFSLQKVTYLAKKVLGTGMNVSGLFYQLKEDQFYNSTLTPEMLFMIQNKLTGMTWFSLKANQYNIVTGALPEERYRHKNGLDVEEKSEIDGDVEMKSSDDAGGWSKLDVDTAVMDADAEMDDEERAFHKNMAMLRLEDDESDMEHEKLRKTWCRAEIDTHYRNIYSHWRELPSEAEIEIMNRMAVSLDLARCVLQKFDNNVESALECLLYKPTERALLQKQMKLDLKTNTIKPAKDPTLEEQGLLNRTKFVDIALAKYAMQQLGPVVNNVLTKLTAPDLAVRKKLETDIAASVKLQDPAWNRNANLWTVSWDLECSNRGTHFPTPEKDAILAISLVLKELVTGEERSLVLTYKIDRKRGIHDDNDPNDLKINEADVIMLDDEADMLKYFEGLFRNGQFAMNTGYNIFKFDWPYILKRAQVLTAEAEASDDYSVKKTHNLTSFPLLSPYRECISTKTTFFTSAAAGERIGMEVKCAGTIVYDLLNWVRNELKLKSNTLNSVASAVLGGTKDDLHHTLIKKMFWGNKKMRERLLHYNWKDSKLVIDIMWDKKNLLWLRNTEICRVCGVTPTDLILRGQGIKTESQLHRIMLRRGFLAPNKSKAIIKGETTYDIDGAELADMDDEEDEEDDKFKGATCIPPKIGWYTDPITTLDFQSLYPSIMSAYNLSYDTFIQCDEDRARLKPEDYRGVETLQGEHDEITIIYYFVRPHVRNGLVCELVDYLLYQRNEVVKKEIKKLTKEGKNTALLEARSTALKLANNSTYG
jgi:DNA polymerase elongation subunit (family B)